MTWNVTRQVIVAHESRKQLRNFLRHNIVRNAQYQYAGILDRIEAAHVGKVEVTRRQHRACIPRGCGDGIIACIAQTKIAHVRRFVPAFTQGHLRGPRQVCIEQKLHAARDGSGCTDSSSTRWLA